MAPEQHLKRILLVALLVAVSATAFAQTFILDENGDPVAESNADAWSEWMADNERVILDDVVRGEIPRVRTIFLGVARPRQSPLAPALFATVVTGGPLHNRRRLWATKAEAVAGHAEAVGLVRAAGARP